MSARYDTQERVHTANIISDEMRQRLPDTQKKSALDYGCGTGLIGLSLIDLFESVLFVDTSPRMLEQVHKKIEQNRIRNAEILPADFSLSAPVGLNFDYVLVSQVLLHVRDYPALLENLHTLLNPDGHLLIVDFNKNENVTSDLVHNGFDLPDLVSQLKGIGFRYAHGDTIFHGKNMFMNQDASLFLIDAQK